MSIISKTQARARRIIERHELSNGDTVWIQTIKGRKYAIIVCPACLFTQPDVTYFTSKRKALDSLADILKHDVLELY